MIFTGAELMILSAPITAILMAGSMQLRVNMTLYSIETLIIASVTAVTGVCRGEDGMLFLACALGLVKGILIPIFLNKTIDRIHVLSDAGAMIPAPLSMHLCIALFGLSYMFVNGLPVPMGELRGWPGATAAISLVLSGLVLMLTRRVAISQILGFLVLENGIYLFALTQTRGMPMIVEMGVLLDVLVGVMIAGLLVFKIQRSFEHIDVTQLKELKD